MATIAKRAIFRSKTLQTYMQNREKSILPQVVAPPVFSACWLVLALLIIAVMLIWVEKLPLYVNGSGIIVYSSVSPQQDTGATAIILVPSSTIEHLQAGLPGSNIEHLQTGLPIQVQIDGSVLNSRITAVSHNPLSPDEIHQEYGLSVAGPAFVITDRLGPALVGNLYAGSLVQAQLQIGSQSLLSLFPFMKSL